VTYAWDGRNRLSSITNMVGNVTAFKYDAGRNLAEIDKTASGVATSQKFVYDSLTNVVSLTAASGLPVSVLTGRSIDSHYASVDSSGIVAFGISDALGSNGGVTNGSGTVTSMEAFDPYGQTTNSPPMTFPFAFTGRIPVTQNVLYFRARFFDTGTNRFLSEDPLGFAGGGISLFEYAENDPLRFTDPSGKGWFQKTLQIAACGLQLYFCDPTVPEYAEKTTTQEVAAEYATEVQASLPASAPAADVVVPEVAVAGRTASLAGIGPVVAVVGGVAAGIALYYGIRSASDHYYPGGYQGLLDSALNVIQSLGEAVGHDFGLGHYPSRPLSCQP
jgi:RHS repeat-associated protein